MSCLISGECKFGCIVLWPGRNRCAHPPVLVQLFHGIDFQDSWHALFHGGQGETELFSLLRSKENFGRSDGFFFPQMYLLRVRCCESDWVQKTFKILSPSAKVFLIADQNTINVIDRSSHIRLFAMKTPEGLPVHLEVFQVIGIWLMPKIFQDCILEISPWSLRIFAPQRTAHA